MHSFFKCPTFRKINKLIAIALLLSLVGRPAQATTSITSNIVVSATVLTACLIVALPLAFGNYDPTATTATTGSTTVTATCTLSAPYTITLGNGSGTGALATGGSAGRKLTLTTGTTQLGYNLYQDSGYATVWGSTAGLILSSTGTGLLQSFNVYGRIPAQQTASSGIYNDTVVATLTF